MPLVGKSQKGFIDPALKPVRKKFMVSPRIISGFRRFATVSNLSQNALLKQAILEMLEQLAKENLLVYSKLLEEQEFLSKWVAVWKS
ncbi:hypothetical protein HHE02_10890 [Helicobacter heilmannii]|uniref:Uncharacterized protein n=1 Tax=Helicobacter heilmannii TaxID=35817 RepID=A0A0K2Y845_HELHE|nr:hypothetical protein [Helicobacter heilmannii]CCM11914.1 hypothetical protein BN341_8760 [Helicobacter heilmannii ASB1.4]CRF47794.1 hypothetical protein HHE02_10890 [Helicobacter heilmannii]CRF50339.1 hypothetical protein HHE06_01630 [Helicobacter heilmannii]CRI35043.1 hypothetical protein HHE01_00410 [Helicobacter heilmannii]BDQ26850.1 hypothetical protein ASB1_05260 [Helicobacter heilmannii]